VDGHCVVPPLHEQPSEGCCLFSAGVAQMEKLHRRHSLKRDACFIRLLVAVKRMFNESD
jgi:hypothetical protein